MKFLIFRSKNQSYLVFAFFSLLIGVVSTLMISKYLLWEYQTDKVFTKSDKVYFIAHQKSPLSRFIETEFQDRDFKNLPQIQNIVSTRFYIDAKLEYENEKYSGICLIADSTFLKIFDYPLKVGNPKTVLSDPNNIVLTDQFAQRLFGEDDPMGKEMQVFTTRLQINYKVAGILKTPPGNTTMQFDYIVASHSVTKGERWDRMGITWLLLNDKSNKPEVEKLLSEKNLSRTKNYALKLVPLSEAYFDFFFDLMPAKHGDRKHLKLLLVILILVFSLSLINFFSIYSLLNTNRKKELGIKKILGAGNTSLFKSFFIGNFIICLGAFGISVLLFRLIYPYFIRLTGKSFVFQFAKDGLILGGSFMLVLLLMSLWAVLFSNRISPLLSSNRSMKPIGSFAPFKVITVVQYSITITLLIVTFSLFRQLNFMLKQDLNFSCDNLVALNFFNKFSIYSASTDEEYHEAVKKQQALTNMLKSELDKSPLINSYSYGMSPLNTYSMSWKKSGDEEYMSCGLITVGPGYDNIFKLELVQGRFFNDELDQDRVQKAVVNEAALRYFDIKDIGTDKLCNSSWGGEKEPWKIIGVVKDFHNEHLSKPVAPLIILLFKDIQEDWYIRYFPGKEAETVVYLKDLHRKVAPGEDFSYKYMEDELAAIFKNDKIQVKLYTILTILALVISLTGIASLSLHHAFKRTKETAIRKVNGCSIGRAVYEMMNPYIVLVFLSFGISCLSGWYFVYEYLKNFANRLPINYWLFGIAGVIALVVSAGILFVALFNVAKRNPIESIHVE